jgi:hypothetical protein
MGDFRFTHSHVMRRLGAIPLLAFIAAVVILVSFVRLAFAQDAGADAGGVTNLTPPPAPTLDVSAWLIANWLPFSIFAGSMVTLGAKAITKAVAGASSNPRWYGVQKLLGSVNVDLAGIIVATQWIIFGAKMGVPPTHPEAVAAVKAVVPDDAK